MTIEIRPESVADRTAIWHLNRAAFNTDAEANLVTALRNGGHVELSLVAEQHHEIVGHILFSNLRILTTSEIVKTLSLAPMAVLPSHQHQGIGSRLVETGLATCRKQGHTSCVVLGHPDFYPRCGFSARLAQSLETPYGGGAAWMAIELAPGALDGIAGRVEYPPPFQAME